MWYEFPNVFVFTLDCNNRIYCYNTEDDVCRSCLADLTQITEVLAYLWVNNRHLPHLLHIPDQVKHYFISPSTECITFVLLFKKKG